MTNKFYISFLIFVLFCFPKSLIANDLDINAKTIEIDKSNQIVSAEGDVEIIDSKYNTNDTQLWSKDWLNNISSKTELLRNLVSEQDLPIVMIDADCMFVKDFYHLLQQILLVRL